MTIRVLHLGLGPIGSAVAQQISERRGLKSVGAVDLDPGKIGRDLGEVIGLDRKLRVKVSDDLQGVIAATRPDIAVLCTGSSLARVLATLETLVAAKVAVVSTTEELSYPVGANRKRARDLDEKAQRAGVAVLGTGVNPGFVMDALPIMLSGVCARVDAVSVERVQDAGLRRLPFQQKIGAGLTASEFEEKVEAGLVRHVGLCESVTMIADALGWKLERIDETIAPRLATRAVRSEFLAVPKGRVCGLTQDGIGFRDGEPAIRLHMEAYLGAPQTYDAVHISGTPPLSMRLDGGVHGDVATASIVVNSIPKVLAAAPGLRTMRDVALPSFFGAPFSR